jgi:hypothetical protein
MGVCGSPYHQDCIGLCKKVRGLCALCEKILLTKDRDDYNFGILFLNFYKGITIQ